ncbi:MAG: MFS transporter, partial [Anaerolineaceae bacterium]|nr:MFS transporter [Anaerolineaceae bacterium]
MSSFIDRYFPYKTFSRPARLYLLSVVISGIIFSAWQLFFNLFILARGYDKVFLGLINAAPWIAGLFFSLPLGALSNRMGRKNAMVAGMGVDFAMRALQVVVQSPELLVIVSFLEGIGFTLLIVSEAPFLMAASDDKNRSLLFSLNFGLLTLSSAVGAVFAGQMPSLVAGRMNVSPESSTAYGAVLLFSLLIGVFSFWPLLRIDESEIHDSKTREQKSSILSALKKPLVWKLFLPNLILGFGAAILIPYMNVFFTEKFLLSSAALGVLFAISSLLTAIGSILGPALAQWMRSKIKAVVTVQGASLGFLVLIGFSPVSWVAELAYLVRGTLMNMASPLYSAFSMEVSEPQDQGAVSSMLNISWQAGWAIGPILSGFIQQDYGFAPLFIATVILYTISTILVWLFFGYTEN